MFKYVSLLVHPVSNRVAHVIAKCSKLWWQWVTQPTALSSRVTTHRPGLLSSSSHITHLITNWVELVIELKDLGIEHIEWIFSNSHVGLHYIPTSREGWAGLSTLTNIDNKCNRELLYMNPTVNVINLDSTNYCDPLMIWGALTPPSEPSEAWLSHPGIRPGLRICNKQTDKHDFKYKAVRRSMR